MEVARAVLWRQRKGTIGNTREVGREVGRFERIARSPVNAHRMTFDGDAESAHYQLTLAPNVQPGSVRIVADGSEPTPQNASDDGAGNLAGDVDPTGANDVDYRHGTVDLTFATAPQSDADNIVVEFLAVRHTQFPTVVLHEGFRRVATTARIEAPLPALRTLELFRGQHEVYSSGVVHSPIHDAQRPGLP